MLRGTIDDDLFLAYGMQKRNTNRRQHESCHAGVLLKSTIEFCIAMIGIANNRVRNPRQMPPNLVISPALRRSLHQTATSRFMTAGRKARFKFFQRAVTGLRILRYRMRIRYRLSSTFVGNQRPIDLSGVLRMASNQGQVGLLNLSFRKHRRINCSGLRAFCQQQDARRWPIETMNRVHKALQLVSHSLHDKFRCRTIRHAAMDKHPRRLGYRDKLIVVAGTTTATDGSKNIAVLRLTAQ